MSQYSFMPFTIKVKAPDLSHLNEEEKVAYLADVQKKMATSLPLTKMPSEPILDGQPLVWKRKAGLAFIIEFGYFAVFYFFKELQGVAWRCVSCQAASLHLCYRRRQMPRIKHGHSRFALVCQNCKGRNGFSYLEAAKVLDSITAPQIGSRRGLIEFKIDPS
jgi:hypothetical protein